MSKDLKQKLYCYVDESNALLRLTDILAGLIRETEEGNTNYSKLTEKLEKEGVINELQA